MEACRKILSRWAQLTGVSSVAGGASQYASYEPTRSRVKYVIGPDGSPDDRGSARLRDQAMGYPSQNKAVGAVRGGLLSSA